jgi:glycosyltransferase involved in cell wall biosynthesis
MSLRACIVVPVYNHRPQVRDFVPRLRDTGLPVILVDDASGRETAELLDSMAAGDPDVILLRHDVNRGKGGAVISGLFEASRCGFSHALQIDADGQHDPRDIGIMLTLATNRPQALIAGHPIFDASAPRGRVVARYLTHVWVWIETLSLCIRDSMCGFRVYPLAETLPLLGTKGLGQRMDFDPEIMVRLFWRGVEIVPVPTSVSYRADGSSNFRLVKDNLLISWMHARLVCGMLIRLPMLLRRKFQHPPDHVHA